VNIASLVPNLLHVASVALLGLFAGAMLTEGMVLVPYWRSVPAEQFFAWYAGNHQRLVGFFGPITWLAGIGALVTAGMAWWHAEPGRWFCLASAFAVMLAVATFFVYFSQANQGFLSASVLPRNLSYELQRWACWHAWRTALALFALISALLAWRKAA
jgi:hypothetical protein